MNSYFGYILWWKFQALKSYFGYQCQAHTWPGLNHKQAHSQQDSCIYLKSKQELHSKINKLKVKYLKKKRKWASNKAHNGKQKEHTYNLLNSEWLYPVRIHNVAIVSIKNSIKMEVTGWPVSGKKIVKNRLLMVVRVPKIDVIEFVLLIKLEFMSSKSTWSAWERDALQTRYNRIKETEHGKIDTYQKLSRWWNRGP